MRRSAPKERASKHGRRILRIKSGGRLFETITARPPQSLAEKECTIC
jgi:hypothetical protein